MSFDTVEENAAFAEKFSFPYPLLCDTSREMGVAYGACDDTTAGYAARISYVIGPDLIVRHAMDVQDAKANPAEILATL